MSSVISSDTKPVVFLCVRDRQRAKAFYCDLLGLTVLSEDDFALVLKVGETSLRIAEVPEHQPQPFTVLGWQLDDMRASDERLAAAGVKGKRFDGMEQNELGMWNPPGSSVWVFWFEDPDGNLLSFSS